MVIVGTNVTLNLIRITHTTTGDTRTCLIQAVSALGGAVGATLANVTYRSGSNSEMRSGYFSPFVTTGTLIYRCTRKD